MVAPAQGRPWQRTVDLRVDDHPDPLAELDRLLDLSDAYALATEGDDLVGQGRHEEAGERYRSASALAPGNHELLFWAGLAAAQAGDLPTALRAGARGDPPAARLAASCWAAWTPRSLPARPPCSRRWRTPARRNERV